MTKKCLMCESTYDDPRLERCPKCELTLISVQDTETGTAKIPGLLHIHAQESWHDDGYIIANRKGLEQLKSLIDQALDSKHAVGVFIPADGEGFALHVALDDSDWQSPDWQHRMVGYRDQVAYQTQGGKISPQVELGYYDDRKGQVIKP